ncbi:hypothetical protein JG688_00004303 [Phytophthora aleatoria]|uniref:Uncharacterized protein n=1 Tax=Phytophthora aleatoria TaxID=2496075 RepID=A0A8J5MBG0_9STRA|nr:hypothetical protein JG688_00004303 [Phytophthora aleatoria]
MDRLDDLPVVVLLDLLSFLQDDLAIKLLSKQNVATCHRNGAQIRNLAAVSKSWKSAIEFVETHFRDSILAFDFQQGPSKEEEQEHIVTTTDDNIKRIPTSNASYGGILQLVWGLFSCSSTGRPTRSLSEEEESRELVSSQREEMQTQRKAQHVDNELSRLLKEITTAKQSRLRVELWLSDPFDVTIHEHGKFGEDKVLQYWGNIFSNCQYLVRLDLSSIPMESDHLPSILVAISENCANLEELVMPQQTHLTHRRRSVHKVV